MSTLESAKSGQDRRLPLGKSTTRRDDSFANAFRRDLEAAALVRGNVTEADKVLIWAAAKLVRRIRQIETRLKAKGKEMSHTEYLAYADRLSRFEHQLTCHVRHLRLDRADSESAMWAEVLRQPRIEFIDQDAPETTPEPLQDK